MSFQEHVSSEKIRDLLAEGDGQIDPPESKHFQFVAVLADDTNPENVPATIGSVLETFLHHRATVTSLSSSLAVALLGVPFPEGNSAEARRAVVAALRQKNGDRVRIAHGECDGIVGMLGGPARWSYGAVIPGFSDILKRLLDSKFGTALELP
jgi:hypothetical protein